MKADYGRIVGTRGLDRDPLDVYVGEEAGPEVVYVIDQMKGPDFEELDEQKFMLGFASLESAKKTYLAHYPNPKILGGIKAVPFPEFLHYVEKAMQKKSDPEKLAACVRAVRSATRREPKVASRMLDHAFAIGSDRLLRGGQLRLSELEKQASRWGALKSWAKGLVKAPKPTVPTNKGVTGLSNARSSAPKTPALPKEPDVKANFPSKNPPSANAPVAQDVVQDAAQDAAKTAPNQKGGFSVGKGLLVGGAGLGLYGGYKAIGAAADLATGPVGTYSGPVHPSMSGMPTYI